MVSEQFRTLRTFETGSWLGKEFQGRGIGKEMRAATLHLGFAGFGAEEATTTAFADNARSLGVTRSLGYEADGRALKLQRDRAGESLRFRMTRAHGRRSGAMTSSSSASSPASPSSASPDEPTAPGCGDLGIRICREMTTVTPTRRPRRPDPESDDAVGDGRWMPGTG